MNEHQLLELIGWIYQAVVDGDTIQTLAQGIAAAFDSGSCLIRYCRVPSPADMPALAGVLCATANFTPRACAAYAEYYHDRNEWFRRGWRRGVPGIVLGQELIDATSLLRSEWADFMRMTDIHHVIGAQYGITDGLVGVIGIHRAAGGDAFEESDRSKMGLLLPHLQRAMQVREQLVSTERRGALTLDLLYRLSVAMVLVTADRRIVFSNQAAEQRLRERGGFTVIQGQLRPCQAADVQDFERMVAEAAKTSEGRGTHAGGILYLKRPMGRREPVLIAPFSEGISDIKPATPLAAIIFSGKNSGEINAQMVARCYGLTPAETKLISALVNGLELAEYAEMSGVSVGTVKTHLKSLFAKTGCHRQVDLVSMVLSDPLFRLASK